MKLMRPPQHKPPAKRLYRPGLGGVAAIDTALDEKNKDAEKARQQDIDLAQPVDKSEIVALVDQKLEKTELIRKIQLREIHLGRTPDHDSLNGMGVDMLRALAKSYGIYHATRPNNKCVHGVYLHEFYCGICSLAIIDPDYDRNLYRAEITKGLCNARRALRSTVKSEKDNEGNFRPKKSEKDEDLRDENVNFEDLQINVDLAIWKATKKYGSEMNGALAYTIARKTAQQFLGDLITEQTIFVGLALEFATPKDREDAERLLSQCDNVQALELLANDGRANPEDRKTAQRLINEYGERIPRFASVDEPIQNEKGEEGDVSAAEMEIHEKEEQAKYRAPDPADILEEHRPALAALVATWRGDQRKVGEAMLAGGFNVRSVPGVSKSQASRLYSVVVKAFKALIANAVTK